MLNSCKVRRNTQTREIDQVVIDRPFTDERANVIYNYYRSVGIPIHLGKQAMREELKKRGFNVDLEVAGWHGSPHYIKDGFRTDRIGTGEGNKAFGWGLYFSDLESIARDYADKLRPNILLIDGKTYNEVRQEIDNPVISWIEIYVKDGLNKEQIIVKLNDKLKDKEWLSKNTWVENNINEALDYISNKTIEEDTSNRNLYSVTLHKGKTPDQYTWLEWDKRLSDKQRDLILKQAQLERLPLEEHTYPSGSKGIILKDKKGHIKAIATNGKQIYEWLYQSVGGSILQSDKEVSLFLLRAGIDGVKYPAESISSGATSDTARGFNYVVFDENAITIEEHIQFLSTPSGEVYGFVTPEGEMFLDPDIAGVNTLIHEGAHIQYKVLKTAAERGDVKAQAILNKIQELTAPAVETIFNAKKAQERGTSVSDLKGNQNLFVVHNISTQNLERSLAQGGLPAPSIAVANVDEGFTSFGEVSLVGSNRIIDPQLNPENRVFGSDIYSPTYPTVDYEITNTRALEQALESLPEELQRDFYNRIQNSIEHQNVGAEGLIENRYLRTAFALNKNKELVGYKNLDNLSQEEQEFIRPLVAQGVKGYSDIADNTEAVEKLQDLFEKRQTKTTGLLSVFFNGLSYYAQNEGKVDTSSTTTNAEEYIQAQNLEQEYRSFVQELYENLQVQEQLFVDIDQQTGNRIYLEHTPENALQMMRNTSIRAGESFSTGMVGAFRALFTPEFSSIQDIQANRDSIVSEQEFEQTRQAIDDEFYSLQTELESYKINPSSNILELMSTEASELYENGNSSGFNQLDPVLHDRFRNFVEILKTAPTEYFEAKPQRVVQIQEFSLALVPTGTSQALKDKLTQTGLEVQEYSSEQDRKQKAKQYTQRNNLAFEAAELSSPAYNQRENETDAQYKERLQEEVFARALGDNAEQYLKDLGFTAQEAKTFLQKVQEFLAEIVDWLRGKKGLQDLSVDEINQLSIREFLDRSTTSMMLGEFKTQTQIVEDNVSFQIIDQQRATPEELQRLRIAQELQRRGVSNSGIWVTTGWEFDTIQNRWVQEVQNELSLKVDPTQIGEYTLENFIEHPELFERFPELKEINIKINTDESFQTVAEFDGKTTITINRNLLQRAMGGILTGVPATSAEQIVSHEIQHVIAGILNFEGGSSPLGISVTIGFIKRGYPATEGRFARISEYVQERFGEDWKNTATSEELEAFSEELYQKSAGEIEAFNTQDRAGLLQTDRTFTAPSETQRFDTGYLLDTSDSAQALLTTDIHGTQEYVPANSIITYYSEIGEINYKRNSEGALVMLKTVSATPQQEESITYQQLLSIPNLSKEQALEAYKNLYSTKFYDWNNKTNECK